MSAVADAATLVCFPIAAASVGSLVAGWRPPGVKLTSAVQHVAAGVVFAAVAGEVLPDLREQHSRWFLVSGFAVGVALLLILRRISKRAEASEGVVPVGLVVLVGVDLLIDGVLVGLGATLGGSEARILTIALTAETLFLGLSLVISFRDRGASRVQAIVSSILTSFAMMIGAVAGAALLRDASSATLAAVLAFGASALLYLVTEELLVEAHQNAETGWLTALFFLGFLAVFLLEG